MTTDRTGARYALWVFQNLINTFLTTVHLKDNSWSLQSVQVGERCGKMCEGVHLDQGIQAATGTSTDLIKHCKQKTWSNYNVIKLYASFFKKLGTKA